MSIDVTSLTNRRATNRWDRVSVGDFWERITWSYPDKEAIVGRPGAFAYPENERLTYRQADELANRVANAMLARGLERGDRVLFFCDNSTEAYVTKIAVAKAGLVSTPINPMLAPDVIADLIQRTDPKLSFVDDELWPKCEKAFAETGLTPSVTIPVCGEVLEGSVSFADFVEGASTAEPDVEIHGDDIWEIIFTSGTTAMPKGVMVSHNYSYLAGYSFALSLTRGLRFECDLKMVTFLPLIFHIADQIFSFPAFLTGGTLVFGRRYDPDGIAQAISDEDITMWWGGSPAMLEEVTERFEKSGGALDASSVTSIVFGWTAIDPKLVDRLRELTTRAGQPARDPRPDRGDLLLPLLARQMAGDLRRQRARDQLRRRAQPAAGLEAGRRGGQLAGRDGRAFRARRSTAPRSSPPATTRTRKRPKRRSAAAGSTPVTSASTTPRGCGSWSTAPRT